MAQQGIKGGLIVVFPQLTQVSPWSSTTPHHCYTSTKKVSFVLRLCFLFPLTCIFLPTFFFFSSALLPSFGKSACPMIKPLCWLLFNEADAPWTSHCPFEIPSIIFNADRGYARPSACAEILERKANGLMDVSRLIRTKAPQQDLSDLENFIRNLNPPLQSASNNQFCATESSRGFRHTRLLIGGQCMEVSRLTENTFGQVNAPFCLCLYISTVFLLYN